MSEWKLDTLVKNNRSYRRFKEDHAAPRETLRELVNLARLSASGANLQPLKYILVDDHQQKKQVFPTLGWAGYLQDWSGPGEGERPGAYIILLLDTEISANAPYDAGIASQSILLGAVERGLGGCILASVRRTELRQIFNIPDQFEILLVLAVGEPAEIVQIDPLGKAQDIRYWRDPEGVHHVPKRSLEEIILDI